MPPKKPKPKAQKKPATETDESDILSDLEEEDLGDSKLSSKLSKPPPPKKSRKEDATAKKPMAKGSSKIEDSGKKFPSKKSNKDKELPSPKSIKEVASKSSKEVASKSSKELASKSSKELSSKSNKESKLSDKKTKNFQVAVDESEDEVEILSFKSSPLKPPPPTKTQPKSENKAETMNTSSAPKRTLRLRLRKPPKKAADKESDSSSDIDDDSDEDVEEFVVKKRITPSKKIRQTVPSRSEGQSNSAPIEIKQETFEEFMKRIENQRLTQAGKSVIDGFKFNKTRCQKVTKHERMPKNHNGILYWMSRDQRVQDNWALLFAQRLALKEQVPLFVCFCLVPKFLDATLRQYAFMLKGLKLVREELHSLNISFHLLIGDASAKIPEFVKRHNIGGVVTDFAPLRVPMGWVENVGKALDKLPIPLLKVDAHNIIPLWVTSSKREYGARTIRPKIHSNLDSYLTEFPPVLSHPYEPEPPIDLDLMPNPFADWQKLLDGLQIDKAIAEVDWAQPGAEGGFRTLKTFVDKRLQNFHSSRNNPCEENALSNLSPWFHFGQISVARAILEVRIKKSKYKESVESFIEEAVVRRELSDNYCFYTEKYDSIEGASEWAQKTLKDHRKDKRKYIYSQNELEIGKTHDKLWNAAQNQMRIEGKMHGFLRMYWAKKILEWTETPEKALQIAIFLNDKYNLDGRDPNGYVGCMWSICGIHDQGWQERPVFGKIRYMNFEGCKRKFNVASFIAKYDERAKHLGM